MGRGITLFLIAGEPSGDALGASLIAALRQIAPDLRVFGIGGPLMAAQGLDSLFPMSDLSVMGLAEVLPRLRHLFARRDQAVAEIARLAPDALITIDSPDFCLRVAAKAKARTPDLPVIHYVAPTVWAWRPKRAQKMARFVDHVLALFPFEPPYMTAAGMGCDFVGHPVVTVPQADAPARAAFRAELGLATQDPLLLLLPGSRRGEIARLGPRFGAVARQFLARLPHAKAVLPAAPNVRDAVMAMAAGWGLGDRLCLIDPDLPDYAPRKAMAFGAADLALAASGTVSLELAASDTPMVIAYDMAPLTRAIMGWMLRIDTVTLVNLVSNTRHIPEFLGRDFRPLSVTEALIDLSQSPQKIAAQKSAAQATMQALGAGGADPGLRAAEAVLRVIARKS